MKYVLIFLVIVLALDICLWLFWMPRYVKRKLTDFQNDLVDRHYHEVNTMYRKMRGWRHDFHNHIQVLQAYLSLGQYGQAQEYLAKLDADFGTLDTVLKTGNVMVDAVLNSKLALIRDKQILVDVTAQVPKDVNISGIDFAVLLGNLLDNAIEACMEIPEPGERFIRIYMDILKKQLYLSVVNSTKGTKKRTGVRFLSEKGGMHGFGLVRIDSIVEKYGGFLNRQAEEGVFATEVTLPLTR